MAAHRSTKRGAIKLFETLGVLIIFLVLLGFALIFYNVVQQSGLQKALAEQAERKSLEISEKALLLPELDCSVTGISELNCIDELKLKAFASVENTSIGAQAEYFNVFESSTVRVRQIWPPTNESITVYNRPPKTWKSATVFTSPVLLYHPLTGANAFALMEVTTYAQ